jgi:hypothetical protein
MKLKLNENGKAFLLVMLVLAIFYVLIFLAWNFTNKDHKPSGLLYDWRKEGYTEDPLGDRKKVQE